LSNNTAVEPLIISTAEQLPGTTRIAYAQLVVNDVPASLHFYRDMVGLEPIWSRGDTTALSAAADSDPVVFLTHDGAARRRAPNSAGLFHMALLYPTRKDLAEAFARLHTDGWQFQGFADHGVSEALYLADAEGNGVELYVDRPRSKWPVRNGELQMVTEPLDLDSLLAELKKSTQPLQPAKLSIGHMHLQVTDLKAAGIFYNETLGFAVTQRSFPGALFVAAGGYHHHIGLNVWNSRGGSPAADGTLGLVRFGISPGSVEAVQSLAARMQDTQYWLKTTGRGMLVRDRDNIQIEIL
jgi:catechol 2,3-dioxygenase